MDRCSCNTCKGLTGSLGWTGFVQVGYPDGTILDSKKTDLLLNAKFYPTGGKDDWPVCPDCKERLPADRPTYPSQKNPELAPGLLAAGLGALAAGLIIYLALSLFGGI